MCFEWKNRFSCGHIGFKKVERCSRLGSGCYGPNGTEKFVDAEGPCYDCRSRQGHLHLMPEENDPSPSPYSSARRRGLEQWK
jgi:xeroderma pigmentosum group C-complementing protein